MINLARVTGDHFRLSNGATSNFSIAEFTAQDGNSYALDAEFLDTLQDFRDAIGAFNIISGCDLIPFPKKGVVNRDIGSAHAIMFDANGNCLKSCCAADGYNNKMDFKDIFDIACDKEFEGIGLYKSFKEHTASPLYLHLDLLKVRATRPLYWYRDGIISQNGFLVPQYKYYESGKMCYNAFKEKFNL